MAYLVLENKKIFKGKCLGPGLGTNLDVGLGVGIQPLVAELVFNSSQCGYEEIATDPSYQGQIVVMTNPTLGNYQVNDNQNWQSEKVRIKAFVCLYLDTDVLFFKENVITLYEVDTRAVMKNLLRPMVGAIVFELNERKAKKIGFKKINQYKINQYKIDHYKNNQIFLKQNKAKEIIGNCLSERVLVIIDFGIKNNIIKLFKKRTSKLIIISCNDSEFEILKNIETADGVVLSNGPGDPRYFPKIISVLKKILNVKPIFGICLGHQILSLALGASIYKLSKGHRGSHYSVKDNLLNKIYITSQNHSYAVLKDSIPKDVTLSHLNLLDKTVAGIFSKNNKCLGVQFHPEGGPGPRDSEMLFDFFIKEMVLSGQDEPRAAMINFKE